MLLAEATEVATTHDNGDWRYWLTAGVGLAIVSIGLAIVRLYRQSRKAKTDADAAEHEVEKQRQLGDVEVRREILEVRTGEMELLGKYQDRFIETLQAELTTLRAQISNLQEDYLKRLIASERHANECEVRLASLEERNRHLEERLRTLEGKADVS